jgi:competence protein ComEC
MRAASHQHSRNPLVLLAAAFGSGILVTPLLPKSPYVVLITASGLILLSLVMSLLRRFTTATVLVLLTFVTVGGALAKLESTSVGANRIKQLLDSRVLASGEPVELTGVVSSAPEHAPNILYFTLDVRSVRFNDQEQSASGVVALSMPLDGKSMERVDALDVRYGAKLKAICSLNRMNRFRNPGVSSITEYRDRKGHDAAGLIKDPTLMKRLGDEAPLLPLTWLFSWRSRIERAIYEKFSMETAGVLAASLLGNSHSLSRESAERFREGGTFHVLVISGLHISFIGALVLLLMRRITRSPVLQFISSNLILWCYTIAVGAEASVVRAALMFSFVAVAPLLSRRAASLNALGGAALTLLAFHPGNLFDPSFQLTFLSVAAIVGLAWPLLQQMAAIGSWRPTRATPFPPATSPHLRMISEALFWSERRWQAESRELNYSYRLFKNPLAIKLERYHLQRLLRYSFGALVVSLTVQVTLLPLFVVYFHRVSLASVALNIGVSVMMAAVLVVALLGLSVSLFSSTIATPLIFLANSLNWILVHSVDPFAAFRLASLRLPEYSGWLSVVYFLYYVPLFFMARSLLSWAPLTETSNRTLLLGKSALLVQIALIVIVIIHPASVRTDGSLRIDFLDVGQGDSALVTMPDGATMLIDGGGRPDFRKSVPEQMKEFERDTRSIGEAVVSEFLWARGLDKVDYLIATHADADHIDGLNDVARNFEVRAALVARNPTADGEFAKFARTAESESIPMVTIGAGDELRFEDVSVDVLWPEFTENKDAPSKNNDSIVLRVRLGDRVILLTGDVEAGAERSLQTTDRDLRADVVKVAHHGSKTSSTAEFVKAANAQWAIISVGQTSMFGHPHAEVVKRWKGGGAEVLTTGSSGTITVITDGKDLRVETFVPL